MSHWGKNSWLARAIATLVGLGASGCYLVHERAIDAGASDAPASSDVGHDAGCTPAGSPECCHYGAMCMGDGDCTDPVAPHCVANFTLANHCAASIDCARLCASPDTPIATPSGERAIAELRVGDHVWSLDRGALRDVPLSRVVRNPVRVHAVVRVTLETMRMLEISPGHPTADGRRFVDLVPGALLDGVRILSVETIPYAFDATYDILPVSDTGTYVAGGVLIGSTLARSDQNAIVSAESTGESRSSVAGGKPASCR